MKLIYRRWKWALVGLLLLGNLIVWPVVLRDARGNYLTLAVLDVGQGDAVFIEDALGRQILIDGGPDRKILSALPALMPFSDRSLDLLILTHPHADHVTGLVEVLKRYRVAAVLESGAAYDSAVYGEWRRLLDERGIKVIPAHRGEIIKLAGGGALEILAPLADWRGRDVGDRNTHNAMVVARLVGPEAGLAMLTGDMEMPLENDLLASGADLQSEILKVGHHGSKTSTSGNFLRAVAPRWAVISSGAGNRYGHPHTETSAALERQGALMRRTDEEGTIIFRFR